MAHAIRLGTHAEKEYLVRTMQWFDEVVLNANLVEGTSGASAVLLLTLAKPYMIDPVTYAFGQSPVYLMNAARSSLKRTFKGLCERYGEPVASAVTDSRSVAPSDFADVATVDGFARRVVSYQEGRIGEALAANEAFLDVESGTVPPVRVVAPYFYSGDDSNWIDVNRRLVEASVAQSERPATVWAVISFDSWALDRPEEIDRLIGAYGDLNCAGILFWPSDFDETRATLGQIRGMRKLVSELCTSSRAGMMLYGGFFSLAMRDEGMSGSIHGVGYGQKRDIVPVVGGGLPPARYYLPAIHDTILVRELLHLVGGMDNATFLREICNCTICSTLVTNGGTASFVAEMGETEERPYGSTFRTFATPRVYRLTRFHYIESKHRESLDIAQSNRDEILARLADSYQRFIGSLGSGRLGYLLRWRDGLSGEVT